MEGVYREEPDRGRLQHDRQATQRGTGKFVGLFDLLDEHGDEIEADLCRFYNVDLVDLYRNKLSVRRLGVLIRHLPIDSALVTALNDGKPRWNTTDNLIADLWAVTVRLHSEKGSLPDDFDHPARAEVTAKERLKSKLSLKEIYLKRKRERRQRRGGE